MSMIAMCPTLNAWGLQNHTHNNKSFLMNEEGHTFPGGIRTLKNTAHNLIDVAHTRFILKSLKHFVVRLCINNVSRHPKTSIPFLCKGKKYMEK
jgi:hypothetical protein